MILRRKKPCPFWLNDKNSFCCVLHCSSLFDQFVSLQTNHHYTFLQSIPRDLKVSLNWMQYPTSQNMADLVGEDFPEKTTFHLGTATAWMGGGKGPNWFRHFFGILFKSEKAAQIACNPQIKECFFGKSSLNSQNIWKLDYSDNCGFCSNRILSYFPLSVCMLGKLSKTFLADFVH